MKKSSPALPGILSPCGHLLTDIQFIAQIADLMHDTAFFIKEAEGRYRVVNRSILEWHGLADKSQMRGQRHCGTAALRHLPRRLWTHSHRAGL